MAKITLKNMRGGIVTFSDEFKQDMDRLGSCGMWSRPVFTITATQINRYDCYVACNAGSFINLQEPMVRDYSYYITENPYKLQLPLMDNAWNGSYDDLRVIADIKIVEPGKNTQSDPGYILRIYGGMFDVYQSGAYMACDAVVGFKIFSIVGNTEIASLTHNGNSNFYRATWQVPSIIQYYPSFPDITPYLYLYYDGTNLMFPIVMGYATGQGSGNYVNYSFSSNLALIINNSIIKNQWHLTTEEEPLEEVSVDPEYGTYSKPGGYTGQSFDDESDSVPLPQTPIYGVTNSGFIHLYEVQQANLINLGGELFPSFPDGTDILGALNTLVKVQTQQNLINYVQDCRVLPVRANAGLPEGIKLAGKTLNTQGEPVTQDYVDFDCGELEVGERYVNFADYEPFTMAKLYLPFVGFVPIAMEYVSGGSLHIIYRFNLIDGSFVAYVKATSSKSALTDSVIAQYGGNCCVHMPITGLNYATMVTGIVGGAMQMVSGVGSMSAGLGQVAQGMDAPNHSRMLAGSGLTLTGYGIGSMTSGVNSMVGGLADILSAKPDYQQSNNYNATTSFLTVRKPYLLIGRPVPQFSAKYPEENGLPLNVTKKLGDCSGFTKVGMCILEGIECTDSEKDMIQSYLNSGVII